MDAPVRRRLLLLVATSLLAACGAPLVSDLPIDGATPTPRQSATPTSTPAGSPTPQGLTIVVMDVGQGDSTLIIGPQKTMLVDGGDEGAPTAVIAKLHARNIGKLDWVVATHPHADHIGGLDEVLHTFDALDGVYDNGEPLSTQAYTNYKAAAQATTGGERLIALGDTFDLGAGVLVTCVAVNGHLADGTSVTVSDPNDYSVGLVVEWGNFRFFVGGDLGGGGPGAADLETPLGAYIGAVDAIKINHHGSDTSTNSAWVNSLSPKVAIISDGDGNSYGHPDAAVLARLTGTDSTVHVPAPDLFLTERGAAPTTYAGAGDVEIDAQQTSFVVAGKHYSAN